MVTKNEAMWKVFINGSCNFKGSGMGMDITDNKQTIHEYSIRNSFSGMNNVAKYDVAIF